MKRLNPISCRLAILFSFFFVNTLSLFFYGYQFYVDDGAGYGYYDGPMDIGQFFASPYYPDWYKTSLRMTFVFSGLFVAILLVSIIWSAIKPNSKISSMLLLTSGGLIVANFPFELMYYLKTGYSIVILCLMTSLIICLSVVGTINELKEKDRFYPALFVFIPVLFYVFWVEYFNPSFAYPGEKYHYINFYEYFSLESVAIGFKVFTIIAFISTIIAILLLVISLLILLIKQRNTLKVPIIAFAFNAVFCTVWIVVVSRDFGRGVLFSLLPWSFCLGWLFLINQKVKSTMNWIV